MDEIWGQACAALETSVGPNNFNHWIKPLRLTGVDAGIAHFASPTRFISDWVNRHFAKDILGELSRHGAPVERLRFEVVPQQAPGRARPAAAAPATRRIRGSVSAVRVRQPRPPALSGSANWDGRDRGVWTSSAHR